MYRLKTLSERKVKATDARNYFLKVFTDDSGAGVGKTNERSMAKALGLYEGEGMNPYQAQLELWIVKTGRDAGLPKPDSDDPTPPVYWGHILELIVAEQYSQQTGRKVRRANALLQHPDSDKHYMLANLD